MISPSVILAIANHLWQSTAVAAVIALLALALRKNPARHRHALWVIASAKFLLPFSLLFALGAYLQPAARQVQHPPAVSIMLGQITEPFSSTTTRQFNSPSADLLAPTLPVADTANRWPFLLIAVWAMGVLAVLLAWSRGWFTVRRCLKISKPVGRIQNVNVMSSPSLLEPGVFGVIKPVLVLPEGISAHLSDEQLQAVLAHELSHVRRRDNLLAALQMLVEAVFWFHPVVWWIGKRLVDEREHACDEAVLQAGNKPEAYAQGILNVCRAYLESPLVCVSGVTGADLKKRVLRIAANPKIYGLDWGRKLLLAVAGVLGVAAPVTFGLLHVVQAHAQSPAANSPTDLSGIWQGTLHVPNGKDLRVVYKIAKTDTGWSAQSYSIDQTPMPIPVTSVTLQGSEVKMSVLRIGGTYEGKMSPDGSTIDGTWTQGKGIPLVLKRVNPDAAWAIPEPPPRPKPMAADANPEFDVATIKLSKPDAPGKGFRVQGRRFTTLNTTLEDLLTFSYRLNARQLVGLPSWATSTKFDLEAQPNGEGQPSDQQWRTMIQKLITDRFQFKYHQDKKEMPVFALGVAKGGPKMTPDRDDPNGLPGLGFRGLGDLIAANADMGQFCELLQGSVLDKPVIDQTGLKGKFDFQMKWTPDPTQFSSFGVKLPPPSTAPDAPPDLFAAIQQQLGLKLDNTKAPVNVFIIDHAQQPSAN